MTQTWNACCLEPRYTRSLVKSTYQLYQLKLLISMSQVTHQSSLMHRVKFYFSHSLHSWQHCYSQKIKKKLKKYKLLFLFFGCRICSNISYLIGYWVHNNFVVEPIKLLLTGSAKTAKRQ